MRWWGKWWKEKMEIGKNMKKKHEIEGESVRQARESCLGKGLRRIIKKKKKKHSKDQVFL